MYRDDPLDDEMELRHLVGDDVVDNYLLGAPTDDRRALTVALDVLRVLQGWVDDDAAARWLTSTQKRLDGHTPVEALYRGAFEEVEDAARAWAAAQG